MNKSSRYIYIYIYHHYTIDQPLNTHGLLLCDLRHFTQQMRWRHGAVDGLAPSCSISKREETHTYGRFTTYQHLATELVLKVVRSHYLHDSGLGKSIKSEASASMAHLMILVGGFIFGGCPIKKTVHLTQSTPQSEPLKWIDSLVSPGFDWRSLMLEAKVSFCDTHHGHFSWGSKHQDRFFGRPSTPECAIEAWRSSSLLSLIFTLPYWLSIQAFCWQVHQSNIASIILGAICIYYQHWHLGQPHFGIIEPGCHGVVAFPVDTPSFWVPPEAWGRKRTSWRTLRQWSPSWCTLFQPWNQQHGRSSELPQPAEHWGAWAAAFSSHHSKQVFPTQKIQRFWSHSWLGNRRFKMATLLFLYNHTAAVVCATLSALLVSGLFAAQMLPGFPWEKEIWDAPQCASTGKTWIKSSTASWAWGPSWNPLIPCCFCGIHHTRGDCGACLKSLHFYAATQHLKERSLWGRWF